MANPEALKKAQEDAAMIRSLLQHPGMKLLTDKINKRIDLKRSEWLAASSPDDAEKIRQDSRVYAALMGMLNEFLVRGSQAQRTSETQDSEGNTL